MTPTTPHTPPPVLSPMAQRVHAVVHSSLQPWVTQADHCVTTHAALVAALEASLLAIPDGMTSNTSPICQQIRAALALAQGKE